MIWKIIPIIIGCISISIWYGIQLIGWSSYNSRRCSIPREENISCEKFTSTYLGRSPVVLRNAKLANKKFVETTSKNSMKTNYAYLDLKISTANSYTGRQWVTMKMDTYLENHMAPQNPEKSGNDTYYLFGSTEGKEWEVFLSQYTRPSTVYPTESWAKRSRDLCTIHSQEDWTSLSFGIAGQNTGVPFHFHGPGFLHMIHGRKQWFLYPPGEEPPFHPNETTYFWYERVYPELPDPPPFECVLEPGDVLYFPDLWMHATLNLDPYNVFIATFA